MTNLPPELDQILKDVDSNGSGPDTQLQSVVFGRPTGDCFQMVSFQKHLSFYDFF